LRADEILLRPSTVALAEDKISPADLVDARNRRVGITINNGGPPGNIPNGTTDCIWFGWQAMEERNPFGGSGSTDTPTKRYVWGTYTDECLQINLLQAAGPQSLPAGYYYLLQDTLYRAVALTDTNGNIVEAYDTDAYGNTMIFTGPGADGTWFTDDDVQSNYGANSIIYCGYRYDPESENYYVRNRYYAPILGHWLTRDPIGYRGEINLYGYVASSPVGKADPAGTHLYHFGPIHYLPGHRFYRNYYYQDFIGQWNIPGNPGAGLLAEAAKDIGSLSEIGKAVNLFMESFSGSHVYWAYDVHIRWEITRVFTYKCKVNGHPFDAKWQSTTKKNLTIYFENSRQHWGSTPNNLVEGAETAKELRGDFTDIVKRISEAYQAGE
jgi:RHS repeat-associated protein